MLKDFCATKYNFRGLSDPYLERELDDPFKRETYISLMDKKTFLEQRVDEIAKFIICDLPGLLYMISNAIVQGYVFEKESNEIDVGGESIVFMELPEKT